VNWAIVQVAAVVKKLPQTASSSMRRGLPPYVLFWRGERKKPIASLYRHVPAWTRVQPWPSDTGESQVLAIKCRSRRGLHGLSAAQSESSMIGFPIALRMGGVFADLRCVVRSRIGEKNND
jgi:hypothetical protein